MGKFFRFFNLNLGIEKIKFNDEFKIVGDSCWFGDKKI